KVQKARKGKGGGGVNPPPAGGTVGQAGRNRASGIVSGVRRSAVRAGRGVLDRRRLDSGLTPHFRALRNFEKPSFVGAGFAGIAGEIGSLGGAGDGIVAARRQLPNRLVLPQGASILLFQQQVGQHLAHG